MKKIFSYIDYRSFLSDFYDHKKSTTTYFSYRWFAQKSGITSPAFFKRVIDNTRNLTQTSVEKFIIGLGLELKEAEYFRVLVAFNQAKTSVEKQKNYAIMLSMADFVKNHQLESDQYRYFDNWYTPVVRELVCMFDFEDDFSKLASTVFPPLNRKEAEDTVNLLLRMELISKNEDGTYEQTDPAVTSGKNQDPMLKLARRSFHEQVIELASKSLMSANPDDRHAVSITMGISRCCYEVILQEISQFQERLVSIVNNDQKSEQVFQMNMQLFKVSEPTSSDENSEV